MFAPRLPFRFFSIFLATKVPCGVLLALVLLAGCGRSESIQTYTPPERERVTFEMDRMLGAIVPLGETTWFFKLQGDDEIVYKQMDGFVKFLATVRTPKSKPLAKDKPKSEDDIAPTWTAPPEWIERPPENEMVHRSYIIPNGEQRAMTLDVSYLPTPESGVDDKFLQQNLTRWWTQYGNDGGISESEIPEYTTKTELKDLQPNGGEAWIANISGIYVARQSKAKRAPSQRNQVNDPHAGLPMPSETEVQPDAPNDDSGFSVKTPDHWKQGAPSAFRKVSMIAGNGAATAEITVIRLPAEVNELLPNLARWRDQVGLPELSPAELEKTAQKITVDGVQGDLVEYVGPQKTMLAAMIKKGDGAWFFKLLGPNAIAAEEKAEFEVFVKTAKLP